jgi:hypothetical protein
VRVCEDQRRWRAFRRAARIYCKPGRDADEDDAPNETEVWFEEDGELKISLNDPQFADRVGAEYGTRPARPRPRRVMVTVEPRNFFAVDLSAS